MNNYLENGVWVKKDSLDRNTGPRTQLLFNLALPTNVLNRATRVGPPGPIVIEKLMACQKQQHVGESCSSSLCLSVLSEDQLQAAVRLAKKDLRRKRQDSINSLSHVTNVRSPSPDKSKTDHQQNGLFSKCSQRAEGPKRQTKSGTQVLVYTPPKLFPPSKAEQGQSPPTRDPGLKGISSEPQLSREIHKLQKELVTYVQRIEQLVNKGRIAEGLEPDEERRIEIRQREQAARSARIIYVLQQQVKEIQEDLDRLRSQSIRPTNKCRAVNRLAAAHRGAVRAIQAFIQQLSDPAKSRVPVQCKELGQLIRQLSLCSAKVEVGQGSTVPETTLDILQKLESLDLALGKQDSQQKQEPRMRSISPVKERMSKVHGRSISHPRFPHTQTSKSTQRPNKSATPKNKRRAAGRPLNTGQFLDQERKEILRTGIQNLMCMREQEEMESRSKPDMDILKSFSSAVHSDKGKPNVYVRDAGFQQPTVSSKLRESKLSQREESVPWIPTSPHSPVKQRVVSSIPEQRCLFSEVNNALQPMDAQTKNQSQGKTSTENIREAQNKALRLEAGSPTLWTKGGEQAAGESPLPQLDCMQTAVSTNVKATDGAVQRVDRENDTLLRDPMLDNMLLRMEEIEKDEEEVRRRFAMISYSDPLLWEKDIGSQRKHNSSRPASPQPIRVTKPAQRHSTPGDIILQRPVETGAGSESSMLHEEPPDAGPSCSSTDRAQMKGGISLNIPSNIQKNIQRYRKEHDSYLHLVSHAAVGSFNPCIVAESLAEELMMEALADVAGEFQDVCEEYAEAIFTSEFLQPIPSPPSVS